MKDIMHVTRTPSNKQPRSKILEHPHLARYKTVLAIVTALVVTYACYHFWSLRTTIATVYCVDRHSNTSEWDLVDTDHGKFVVSPTALDQQSNVNSSEHMVAGESYQIDYLGIQVPFPKIYREITKAKPLKKPMSVNPSNCN